MFFQIVAATFLGGLLLSLFLWAGWTATRLEKQGVPQDGLPFMIYFYISVPLMFVTWMMYTTMS